MVTLVATIATILAGFVLTFNHHYFHNNYLIVIVRIVMIECYKVSFAEVLGLCINFVPHEYQFLFLFGT